MPRIVTKEETVEEDEEEEDVPDKEERKSLKKSLDSLQNTLLEFQVWCGLAASYLERLSNMAHWQEVLLGVVVWWWW